MLKEKNIPISLTGLLVILLLMVFSPACNKLKNKSSADEIELPEKVYPLVLKKEKEYRFDVITKGGPFFGKVEDKENLYAYFLQNQDGNCQVFKMSTDLEVKGTYIIPRATGPGEAQNPRIYGGDKNSIIVWDAPGFKYIKFDANFKLMDEYRLGKDLGTFLYSGGRYVENQNFVLDGFLNLNTRYDANISVYKIEFPTGGDKVVKTMKLFDTTFFDYWRDNKRFIIMRPINFGYFFGYIYILDKRTYRLLKMDPGGTILKEIKIVHESKSFPKPLRLEWIQGYYKHSQYGLRRFDFPEKLYTAVWLIQVGDGIAVGRCENYDPEIKGPVPADYFDRDLNYLGKIELPYFYYWNHPETGQYHVDIRFYSKDGKLYFLDTRDDDEYWIVRYQIKTGRGDSHKDTKTQRKDVL